MRLKISHGEIGLEIDEHPSARFVMIFAHGAGAPMLHPFMTGIGTRIARQGGHVIRFNFPYIEKGRKSPGAPGPNIDTIGEVVAFAKNQFPQLPLFLSGKSYGGRMSSHWLHGNPTRDIRGIIYFGFPLHAPGRQSKDRAQHLYSLEIPQFFIQGTRDTLANYELIQEVVAACPHGELLTIQTGDHGFKVLKKETGKSQEEVLDDLATHAVEWIYRQL